MPWLRSKKKGTLTIETLYEEKNVTVLIIDKRFFTPVEIFFDAGREKFFKQNEQAPY